MNQPPLLPTRKNSGGIPKCPRLKIIFQFVCVCFNLINVLLLIPVSSMT